MSDVVDRKTTYHKGGLRVVVGKQVANVSLDTSPLCSFAQVALKELGYDPEIRYEISAYFTANGIDQLRLDPISVFVRVA